MSKKIEIRTKNFNDVIEIFNYFNIDLLKIFKNTSNFKGKIKNLNFCVDYMKNIFGFDSIETAVLNKINSDSTGMEQIIFKAIDVNTNIASNFDFEIKYFKISNGYSAFIVSIFSKLDTRINMSELLEFINDWRNKSKWDRDIRWMNDV